jgi:hypothetical protein
VHFIDGARHRRAMRRHDAEIEIGLRRERRTGAVAARLHGARQDLGGGRRGRGHEQCGGEGSKSALFRADRPR